MRSTGSSPGTSLAASSFPSVDGMHTIQTNIFGQGQSWGSAPTFEKWVHKPYDEFHKYSVEWDADYIRWYVDDRLKREVHPKDIPAGSRMPQGPMKLQLGFWDGGDPDNSYWTKQWAGDETDLKAGPSTAYVRSVNITNNYPACQFKFDGKSGMRDSIQVIATGCSASSAAVSTTKPLSGSLPGLKMTKDKIPGENTYGLSGILPFPYSFPSSLAESSSPPVPAPGPASVFFGRLQGQPPPSSPRSSIALPPASASSAPLAVSGVYSVKPSQSSLAESSAAKPPVSVPSSASSGSDRVSPTPSSSHTSLAAAPPTSAPASVPPGGYRLSPASSFVVRPLVPSVDTSWVFRSNLRVLTFAVDVFGELRSELDPAFHSISLVIYSCGAEQLILPGSVDFVCAAADSTRFNRWLPEQHQLVYPGFQHTAQFPEWLGPVIARFHGLFSSQLSHRKPLWCVWRL